MKREELYQLVWSLPITALAARYGVSGVALAKLCRRRQVPVPPRGYWAKHKAGHRVSRPPLLEFMKPPKTGKPVTPIEAASASAGPQLPATGRLTTHQEPEPIAYPQSMLSAHTVVLVRAAIGWEETEQLENLFRVPVIAFFTDAGDMGGYGTCNAIPPHERARMALSVRELHEMVASPVDLPHDIGAFVDKQMAMLRTELERLEKANKIDHDGRRLDAAHAILRTAESLTFTLFTRDARID
jgi:hypothetical protein